MMAGGVEGGQEFLRQGVEDGDGQPGHGLEGAREGAEASAAEDRGGPDPRRMGDSIRPEYREQPFS